MGGVLALGALSGDAIVLCAERPGGRWEAGMHIPRVNFDADAPIRDLEGLDDEIANATGHGFSVGYNFTSRHAVNVMHSSINSSGEDRHGTLHFAIDTRFTMALYQYRWPLGRGFALFGTAGIGAFGARARTSAHLNTTGIAYQLGGCLEYFVAPRASVKLFVNNIWVELDPDDAVSLMSGIGASLYMGDPPSD